jgi:hypothetical protein
LANTIKTLTAVKIIHCYGTNSLPLQVLCDDNELYVIKSMFKSHPPFEDLINEVLCNNLLQSWGIPVPEPAIVILDNVVIEQYVEEGNSINDKYKKFDFSNHFFFGTKFLYSTTEIDLYNLTLKNKYDFNKYENPIDLIKIGVFDKWIANMDRRSDNPNILMDTSSDKFRFIPIDNTQAFAYQNNYKGLNKAIMDAANIKSILNTPITKSICKFAKNEVVANFEKVIIGNIENSIETIDLIFENIPSEFGLSAAGKNRIKLILSDKERNKKVSQFHLNYL